MVNYVTLWHYYPFVNPLQIHCGLTPIWVSKAWLLLINPSKDLEASKCTGEPRHSNLLPDFQMRSTRSGWLTTKNIHTSNTDIRSRIVLRQTGQCLHFSEQKLHKIRCRQGMRTTAMSLSKHTRHSTFSLFRRSYSCCWCLVISVCSTKAACNLQTSSVRSFLAIFFTTSGGKPGKVS